jgi:hypothetical protein
MIVRERFVNMKYLFAWLVIIGHGCAHNQRSLPEGSDVKTVAFARNFDHTNLEVCWEIETNDTSEFREEFFKFTSKAFEDSVIRFHGWRECVNENSADIRLFIYDDKDAKNLDKFKVISEQLVKENNGKFLGSGHPQLRGKTGKEKPSRVVLNRTFLNADPKITPMILKLSPRALYNLSISSSIHEIGHALGLRHEDAHPEKTCLDFHEELGDSKVVTKYNPTSFMSRCFYRTFDYDSGVLLPNEQDLNGINLLYKGVSGN